MLEELIRDDGIIAFQGLRRRLGMHQQALQRALQHLEDDGLVESHGDGYQATETAAASRPDIEHPAEPTSATIALPPDADVEDIIEALAGKWWSGLWWLGRSDGPGETTLMWVDGDGRIVRLRIGAGILRIEGTAPGALLSAIGKLL